MLCVYTHAHMQCSEVSERVSVCVCFVCCARALCGRRVLRSDRARVRKRVRARFVRLVAVFWYRQI